MKFKATSVRVREVIRNLMHDKEIPMTRISYEAKINYSTIRAYFAGRTVMRVDMIERILDVLGVDLSDAISDYAQRKISMDEFIDAQFPTEH